jgi:decaprenyl-phosphate phosphoribosyltransferase
MTGQVTTGVSPSATSTSDGANGLPVRPPDRPRRPLPAALLKLARPTQWSKSVFVFIGPLYGLAALKDTMTREHALGAAAIAAALFALVSSACYIVNDLVDVERDRAHPRKRWRPIACGEVSPRQAAVFAMALVVAGVGLLFALDAPVRLWVALCATIYALNVILYSFLLKGVVMADVLCLALGFVLRVFGGCAAVGIAPSTWLLNSTLFLAMFLSFGKRLGERRTMGSAEGAASVRAVHQVYTDEMLRMVVVVTAVATLITYAGYVQSQEERYQVGGLNLLWLTMLPAVFALLRCIVLLERGDYDDPTELAVHDRPFQLAAVIFGGITVVLLLAFRMHSLVPAAALGR